jgi:hypothetical protein
MGITKKNLNFMKISHFPKNFHKENGKKSGKKWCKIISARTDIAKHQSETHCIIIGQK